MDNVLRLSPVVRSNNSTYSLPRSYEDQVTYKLRDHSGGLLKEVTVQMLLYTCAEFKDLSVKVLASDSSLVTVGP